MTDEAWWHEMMGTNPTSPAESQMKVAIEMDSAVRLEKLTPRQKIRLGFWDRFVEATK